MKIFFCCLHEKCSWNTSIVSMSVSLFIYFVSFRFVFVYFVFFRFMKITHHHAKMDNFHSPIYQHPLARIFALITVKSLWKNSFIHNQKRKTKRLIYMQIKLEIRWKRFRFFSEKKTRITNKKIVIFINVVYNHHH